MRGAVVGLIGANQVMVLNFGRKIAERTPDHVRTDPQWVNDDALTRENTMKQAASLKELEVPILLKRKNRTAPSLKTIFSCDTNPERIVAVGVERNLHFF